MKQIYENYTAEDHQVWSILYGRQMDLLPARASKAYLDGIQHSGFVPDKIPRFTEVNERLSKLTGWQVYEVPGIVPDKEFFELLAEKKFPATTWIRKMEQLDYLEEPDMFHDVFGHVPLLANQSFVLFLEAISKIALKHINDPYAVELMSRIYWFTVEFGLILEGDDNKIYGAGILSSSGESVYSLESDAPVRRTYDVAEILDEPYIKEKFQVKYFIAPSYEELYDSIGLIEELLEQKLA